MAIAATSSWEEWAIGFPVSGLLSTGAAGAEIGAATDSCDSSDTVPFLSSYSTRAAIAPEVDEGASMA